MLTYRVLMGIGLSGVFAGVAGFAGRVVCHAAPGSPAIVPAACLAVMAAYWSLVILVLAYDDPTTH